MEILLVPFLIQRATVGTCSDKHQTFAGWYLMLVFGWAHRVSNCVISVSRELFSFFHHGVLILLFFFSVMMHRIILEASMPTKYFCVC